MFQGECFRGDIYFWNIHTDFSEHLFIYLFFIELYLICNLISAVQQSNSVVHINAFFFVIFNLIFISYWALVDL